MAGDSRCPGCDGPWAAAPAGVRLREQGQWIRVPDDTPVHAALLFRDPGIRSGRRISTVLDLREQHGELIAGYACWVGSWLDALGELPTGLTVALDNGVRCPCPTELPPAGRFCLPWRFS